MSSTFLGLATFRDYGPELTLLLSDMHWITFLMQWPPFWIQSWSMAWAILSDRSPNPAFPKSLGVVNFVAALALSSATALHLYHHGPYAWNGALTFWFGFGLYVAQVGLDLISFSRNVHGHRRMESELDTIRNSTYTYLFFVPLSLHELRIPKSRSYNEIKAGWTGILS
ncbi:hypothetical protein AbraIFM66950_007890 [Aspergillus brasiliensis]|nr:hypothetical protein AbraIFM66950_007890 [Aspergillus brasiliensis]